MDGVVILEGTWFALFFVMVPLYMTVLAYITFRVLSKQVAKMLSDTRKLQETCCITVQTKGETKMYIRPAETTAGVMETIPEKKKCVLLNLNCGPGLDERWAKIEYGNRAGYVRAAEIEL